MADLREAHLRYLLAIHELGRVKPDVGMVSVSTDTLSTTQ
jgi:hypothetical protein